VRDDISLVLDRDSVDVVTGNVTLFTERAGLVGGGTLLAELDDFLSNFLTIGPRLGIVSESDPDIILDALISEHCSAPA
jgi:hypothetical protein